MSNRTAYMYISALGVSPEFLNFRRKHQSVTNWTINRINSTTNNDFEANILHLLDDNVEKAPLLGLSATMTDGIMSMVDLIITKSNNSMLSASVETTKAELENHLTDFEVGIDSIIRDSDTKLWPKTITLTYLTETAIIYFYAPSFETSYPNSNIEVITLLENPDEFGSTNLAGIVAAKDALESLPFATRFKAITEEVPCTSQEILMRQWVNQDNLTESTMIPFGLVCYGNPSDEDKDAAIRKHMEDNSILTATELENIFPDLFGSVGFDVFPYWDTIAVDTIRDIYSPVHKADGMLTFLDNHIPHIPASHASTNWELLPTTFQSLTSVIIPDLESIDTLGTFSDNIDRYYLVGPTDPEFVTMPSNTREFVKTLFEAFDIAESYPDADGVTGIDIDSLDGMKYVTFHHGGLRWRILTKESYLGAI